jgi:hypothetical protein
MTKEKREPVQKAEIIEVLRRTGTLPTEVVLRALVSALCGVYEGEVEVSVAGIGIRVVVDKEGVSLEGCEHCLEGIEDGNDDHLLPMSSVAVSGV